jgi:hypothetical protein
MATREAVASTPQARDAAEIVAGARGLGRFRPRSAVSLTGSARGRPAGGDRAVAAADRPRRGRRADRWPHKRARSLTAARRRPVPAAAIVDEVACRANPGQAVKPCVPGFRQPRSPARAPRRPQSGPHEPTLRADPPPASAHRVRAWIRPAPPHGRLPIAQPAPEPAADHGASAAPAAPTHCPTGSGRNRCRGFRATSRSGASSASRSKSTGAGFP